MTSLVLFLFFCVLAIVLVASAIGLNYLETRRKQQVKEALHKLDGSPVQKAVQTEILNIPEDDNPLMRLTSNLNIWTELELTIQQSGLEFTPTGLAGMMFIAAIVGFVVGWKVKVLIFRELSAPALAVAFGFLPLLYVRWQRKKRFAEFEEQFPEALDFLARAMRAGHAFSVCLDMLGAESPDPVGLEFRTLFNEQNLGSPIEVCFANMIRRTPLPDVRFFISAVMLQKRTGGNLSEILSRLSYIIRERFQLRGQVKASSSHGRMTAGVLLALPIALMLALMAVAPDYLKSMANDPDGKWLIVAAVIAQGLGFYTIRRIINVKI